MRNVSVVAFAAAAMAFIGVAPELSAKDRIWKKSGGRPVIADSVSKENYDEIKYRRGSVDLTLPGNTIRIIDYGDAPESYALGLEKRAAGEFENAEALLNAAMSESGVRSWIQVYGPFQLGETYRQWGAQDRGKYAKAIAQYDKVLSANDKTRLRPETLMGRAQAHLGNADLDKALADLDTLMNEAKNNGYGVAWELQAMYEKARALEDAAKTSDAKRTFSRLETLARSFASDSNLEQTDREVAAEMAGLARLAQGRVLIADGKGTDAERFFGQIADDEGEVDSVRAAALVGKGEALLTQDKLKEAQYALAQVRIQYFSSDEAVAEATYRLGLVSEALGSAEPKGSRLAQDYFLEVARRYSGSRWAQKAQEKLR